MLPVFVERITYPLSDLSEERYPEAFRRVLKWTTEANMESAYGMNSPDDPVCVIVCGSLLDHIGIQLLQRFVFGPNLLWKACSCTRSLLSVTWRCCKDELSDSK